jgi:DNA polymerase-3 subunit delta'
VAAISDWSPADLIDALQKLCHDLVTASRGAAPRFFAASDLQGTAGIEVLLRWDRKLQESARIAEHPLNAGLMLEALVAQAKSTLNSRP